MESVKPHIQPDEKKPLITDLFDKFIEASTLEDTLLIHGRILGLARLSPCEFNVFFNQYKRAIICNRTRKNWKAKALFSKIDKKANHRCYLNTRTTQNFTPHQSESDTSTHESNQKLVQQNVDNLQHLTDSDLSTTSYFRQSYQSNDALRGYNCLVIGGGPAGLRTAIELQFLGAKRVCIVEKRNGFSRNNVLHLWPFLIEDLKSLGAKKFYGKFCAGSIDHISIRQLQLILLKFCLMIGCDFRQSCTYLKLCPEFPPKQQVNNRMQHVTSPLDSKNQIEIKKNEINISDNLDHEAKQNATDQGDTTESIEYEKCDLDETTGEDPQFDLQSMNNFGLLSSNIVTDIAKDNISHNGADATPLSRQHNSNSALDSTKDEKYLDVINHENNSIDSINQKINSGSKSASSQARGVRAHFSCDTSFESLQMHSIYWDIIIGADGRRNTLGDYFPRKEFRGRLAIAITANFINHQTPVECAVPEISGLSYIYNQDMFNALCEDTRIDLENICYYKDDTHYFVMTAKKKSLLEKGVLIRDCAQTQELLAENNINRDALLKYAKDVAYWTTGLENLEFALNHHSKKDCAMFDFTSMNAATNACKAIRTRKDGSLVLLGLVGDSLLEPFWPTGSGCARGFLTSFDAAWMCRQWAVHRCGLSSQELIDSGYMSPRSVRSSPISILKTVLDHKGNKENQMARQHLSPRSPDHGEFINRSAIRSTHRIALSVMAERESIYRILAQTTSENLHQSYSRWTLNPHTRYPNLNRHLVSTNQIEHLISDNNSKFRVLSCEADINHSTRKKQYLKALPICLHRGEYGTKNVKFKSPGNTGPSSLSGSLRKSCRKLRSTTNLRSSPVGNVSLWRLSKSSSVRPGIAYSEASLELEKSYHDLEDPYYCSRRAGLQDSLDSYSFPSVSGTAPSRNNLNNLEMKRAREIDDCLRQRRQKTQINAVREHFMYQFGRFSERDENRKSPKGFKTGYKPKDGAIFNELRSRMQLRGLKNQSNTTMTRFKDTDSPLRLLNSIRRCASFAERVKSFEATSFKDDKIQSKSECAKKNLVDNVKNLPQFAALEQLLLSKEPKISDTAISKPKIQVMKLTKDDWNVKCWEERLSARQKQQQSEVSTKSLHKTVSLDSYGQKPEKQVNVFRDRIREMANKLDNNQSLSKISTVGKGLEDLSIIRSIRSNYKSKSWIDHLQKELTKGSRQENRQATNVNSGIMQKPIRKLFESDEESESKEDGIDFDKHYDHLCTNKFANKYLTRNGYSSHLSRVKYDANDFKSNSRGGIRLENEKKLAFSANLPSRVTDSSACVASDTTGSSSETYTQSPCGSIGSSVALENSQNQMNSIKCFRCGSVSDISEMIRIDESTLHRSCLNCETCSTRLRIEEVQYYLRRRKNSNDLLSSDVDEIIKPEFSCCICRADVREELAQQSSIPLARIDIERKVNGSDTNLKNEEDDEETDDTAGVSLGEEEDNSSSIGTDEDGISSDGTSPKQPSSSIGLDCFWAIKGEDNNSDEYNDDISPDISFRSENRLNSRKLSNERLNCLDEKLQIMKIKNETGNV